MINFHVFSEVWQPCRCFVTLVTFIILHIINYHSALLRPTLDGVGARKMTQWAGGGIEIIIIILGMGTLQLNLIIMNFCFSCNPILAL